MYKKKAYGKLVLLGIFWLSGVILWNTVGYLFEFKNMGAIFHVWCCSATFFLVNSITILIFILTNDGNKIIPIESIQDRKKND